LADAASRARAAGSTLEPGGGALGVFVTDATRLDELAPRFLGQAWTTFQLVDL
jgi:hypothetical protein